MNPRLLIKPGDWIRCKYCLVNFPFGKFLVHRDTCECKLRRRHQHGYNGQKRITAKNDKCIFLSNSPSDPQRKIQTLDSPTTPFMNEAVPVVDLTLSGDEDDEKFYLPGLEGDEYVDTAASHAPGIPANLRKCFRCEEYFFSLEELRIHCFKFHPEPERVEARNLRRNKPSKPLLVAVSSAVEKSHTENDNIASDINEKQIPTKDLVTNTLDHSVSIQKNSRTEKESNKNPVDNLVQEQPCSVDDENTFKENHSEITAKTDGSEIEKKVRKITSDYYVQRTAAKKSCQYNDNICPYCKRDFKTTVRCEAHITSKHERKYVKSSIRKRIEQANATRKLMEDMRKKYKSKQQCPQCPAWLVRSALPYHLLTHSGEKPYSCRYCELSFRAKYRKVQHESCCKFSSTNKKKNVSQPGSRRLKLHAGDIVISSRPRPFISVGEPNHDLKNGVHYRRRKATALNTKTGRPRRSVTVQPVVSTTTDEAYAIPEGVTTIHFCDHLSSAGTVEKTDKPPFRRKHSRSRKQRFEKDDHRKSNRMQMMSTPPLRAKTKSKNLDTGRAHPAVNRKRSNSLDEITEHTSRSLIEVLAPFTEIDEVSLVKDAKRRKMVGKSQGVTERRIPKYDNYRCLVCQEVIEGETNTRQHVRFRHGRIMQFVLNTEGNPKYNKRVVKLCKKVMRVTRSVPNEILEKTKSECNGSEVPADIPGRVDENCSRLIVKTRGNQVLSCALLTPPESVIISNESRLSTKPENISLSCEFCSRTFQSQAIYLLHVVQHKGVSVKHCVTCNKVFVHTHHYYQHMLSVHNLHLADPTIGFTSSDVLLPDVQQTSAVNCNSEVINNPSTPLNRQQSVAVMPKQNKSKGVTVVQLVDTQNDSLSVSNSGSGQCKKYSEEDKCDETKQNCELSLSPVPAITVANSNDSAAPGPMADNFHDIEGCNYSAGIDDEQQIEGHQNIEVTLKSHSEAQINDGFRPTDLESNFSAERHVKAVGYVGELESNQKSSDGEGSCQMFPSVRNSTAQNETPTAISAKISYNFANFGGGESQPQPVSSPTSFDRNVTFSRIPSTGHVEFQNAPYLDQTCSNWPPYPRQQFSPVTPEPYEPHFAPGNPILDNQGFSHYKRQVQPQNVTNHNSSYWSLNSAIPPPPYENQIRDHVPENPNTSSFQIPAQSLYDSRVDFHPDVHCSTTSSGSINSCGVQTSFSASSQSPILNGETPTPTYSETVPLSLAQNPFTSSVDQRIQLSQNRIARRNFLQNCLRKGPQDFESALPGFVSNHSNFDVNSNPKARRKSAKRKSALPKHPPSSVPNIPLTFPYQNNNLPFQFRYSKPKNNVTAPHQREVVENYPLVNLPGGAVLQKIPVPPNIRGGRGSRGRPPKLPRARKEKVDHFNKRSATLPILPNNYSPESGVCPVFIPRASHPVQSMPQYSNNIGGPITENMEIHHQDQIVYYQEGSKSKMLNRRQCPYCYSSYQSELALQDHLNSFHTDFGAGNAQQPQSQLIITAHY